MGKIYVLDDRRFKTLYPYWSRPVKNKYVHLPKERFIVKYKTTSKVTAIDNSTLNAWTEDFDTVEQAVKYLREV